MPLYCCRGCLRSWNQSAHLTQHLEKTSSGPCRQYHQELLNRHRPVRGGPWRDGRNFCWGADTLFEFSGEAKSTTQFEGDFFGTDYKEEDFPLTAPTQSEPVHGPAVEVEENDEAETDGEGEEVGRDTMNPGSEPSLGSQHPRVATIAEQDTPDRVQARADDHIGELRESLEEVDQMNVDGEDHRQAAQNTLESSAIVEPFGGLAGTPVQGESLGSAFERYQGQIIGGTYAPFSSRLDWEVAKWAKLRGLGSTAFSDLLSIDGVRRAGQRVGILA